MKNYADLFCSLGTFDKEYDSKLRNDVQPVVHAPRRVPQSIQNKLKMKLNELVKQGIIEPASDSCVWVNHLVIAEKKDKEKSLRLCLDPQELNKAIVDEHSYIHNFEEIASKLHNMNYFSVLDLKDGYWHVKLSERSKNYCAFATPFGIYRFTRLPFGIKTAPSVFQKMNNEIFGDIEGVMIYFDDIMIYAQTKKEHDNILKRVLQKQEKRTYASMSIKSKLLKGKLSILVIFSRITR